MLRIEVSSTFVTFVSIEAFNELHSKMQQKDYNSCTFEPSLFLNLMAVAEIWKYQLNLMTRLIRG